MPVKNPPIQQQIQSTNNSKNKTLHEWLQLTSKKKLLPSCLVVIILVIMLYCSYYTTMYNIALYTTQYTYADP